MTSLVGVNEPLRPSLMIILGASCENTARPEGDGIVNYWQEREEVSGGVSSRSTFHFRLK